MLLLISSWASPSRRWRRASCKRSKAPWARTIGEALPLTHFVRATRGVLLKGEGASLVVSEMMSVALFALVAAVVALAAYRHRID
jgi:ABC-2 type transport system permease protein